MTGDPHGTSSARAANRAVGWLLGGLAGLALAVVLLAPELLADLRGLGGVVLVTMAAGLPGLAIVLWVAARRRRGRGGPEAADHDGPRRGADDEGI